jgi:hypothetical protein
VCVVVVVVMVGGGGAHAHTQPATRTSASCAPLESCPASVMTGPVSVRCTVATRSAVAPAGISLCTGAAVALAAAAVALAAGSVALAAGSAAGAVTSCGRGCARGASLTWRHIRATARLNYACSARAAGAHTPTHTYLRRRGCGEHADEQAAAAECERGLAGHGFDQGVWVRGAFVVLEDDGNARRVMQRQGVWQVRACARAFLVSLGRDALRCCLGHDKLCDRVRRNWAEVCVGGGRCLVPMRSVSALRTASRRRPRSAPGWRRPTRGAPHASSTYSQRVGEGSPKYDAARPPKTPPVVPSTYSCRSTLTSSLVWAAKG